jgi:phosphate transport system permease protein
MAVVRTGSREDVDAAVRRALLKGRGSDPWSLLFRSLLLLALLVSLTFLVTLLAQSLRDGVPVFRDRGIDFITSKVSSLPEQAGVWQGIRGSLTIVGFVTVLAIPLGIAAAVYMEEYARETRITRVINANIRNLAGVPSIVYGLLGIALFVQFRGLSAITGGRSVISAGLTMAILVLPIVIITSAEALRAVPLSIREAAFGVGATRSEVVRSHVLPYALPGILTGTILTLARAFGEAAPLILVGASTGFLNEGSGSFIERLQGPYTALPVLVFDFATRNLRAFKASTAAAALTLLGVLLVVNGTAIVMRNRYDRKW